MQSRPHHHSNATADFSHLCDTAHELTTIGTMLLDPSTFDEITSIVAFSDFSDPVLSEFFRFVCDLHELGKPINDMPLIVTESKKRNLKIDEAGIAAVFTSVAHTEHSTFYAKEVAELSRLRKLANLQSEVHDRLKQPGANSSEISNTIEGRLKSIDMRSTIEVIEADEAVREFEKFKPAKMMAMSGLPRFDGDYGGFAAGELIVIGARLGTGKTAMGWQMMMHSARNDRQCMFVSLEMGSRELLQRHVATATGISPVRIRTDDFMPGQREQIKEEMDSFRELPISFFVPPTTTVRQISAAARLRQSGRGLSLLIIDYAQLVKSANRKKDRRAELEEISRELKALARDLQIPVITLAQLNRTADDSKVPPKVSHIAECDNFARDADQVFLLHRTKHQTDMYVAKHRFVEDNAVVNMRYDNGKFEELPKSYNRSPA